MTDFKHLKMSEKISQLHIYYATSALGFALVIAVFERIKINVRKSTFIIQ